MAASVVVIAMALDRLAGVPVKLPAAEVNWVWHVGVPQQGRNPCLRRHQAPLRLCIMEGVHACAWLSVACYGGGTTKSKQLMH